MVTSAEQRAKKIVETPDRVLARKIASRVKEMNPRASEFESLIFLVAEFFAGPAIRDAENAKLEEAEIAILNEHSVAEPDDLNIGLLRASRAVKALRIRSLITKD